MHGNELIQEHINSLSILYQPQHQLLLWKRYKWVLNLTNPHYRWLSIRIQRQVVEVYIHIVCYEANRCILSILEVIQCHFY